MNAMQAPEPPEDTSRLRVPPHSVEAEQSVLGGLLLEPGALSRVTDVVVEADFFRHEHRLIFGAITQLASAGQAFDIITVFEQLQQRGKALEVGGLAHLNALSQSVPSASNIRRYAEIVAERAALRDMISASDEIATAAYNPQGRNLAGLLDGAKTRFRRIETRSQQARFMRVDVLATQTEETPARWYWAGYVPPGQVTVLAAHGGAGKSTLALALAAHCAVGREYLGRATRDCNAAFFSGEDPGPLTRSRLHKVIRYFGLPPDTVAERLHVLDATEDDPVLYRHEHSCGSTTEAYAALRRYLQTHEIDFVVIDNASDCFDGDEIRRAAVRRFMQALAQLVRDRGGAVLLLAHVDKNTAKGISSETYSGSTAWHNSARSRLFLKHEKRGELELHHEKCNLGPKQEALALSWPMDGMPDIERALQPVVQAIRDNNDLKAVLRLICEFTDRGEFVSTAITSRTHAGKLLRRERGFPVRLADADLFDLLRTAERAGRAQRISYRGADRKERERWEVTSDGRAFACVAATAATCATTAVTAGGAASPAEPAATAATSPPRGVGKERAQKSPHRGPAKAAATSRKRGRK